MLKYHWYKCQIKKGIPELMEDKFDDIKYFSKEELSKNNELSSNMKTLISSIDLETIQ